METKPISHKRILLAEDNVVNQKITVRQLLKLGYHADAVVNGCEAVEALGRIPYDLVFMDCQMPEMDGYEATGEIRRREGFAKHTPIVAMTAHALPGDRGKCLAAGMDDYVAKPVRTEELIRVLDLFLKEAKSESIEVLPDATDELPADLHQMHEAMGDEPEEFAEILNLYLETMTNNLERLAAAMQSGDHDEVERIAHNSAGTSATCGMRAMVGSLRELEVAGRQRRLADAPRRLAQAKIEFERIQAFLNEHVIQPVA